MTWPPRGPASQVVKLYPQCISTVLCKSLKRWTCPAACWLLFAVGVLLQVSEKLNEITAATVFSSWLQTSVSIFDCSPQHSLSFVDATGRKHDACLQFKRQQRRSHARLQCGVVCSEINGEMSNFSKVKELKKPAGWESSSLTCFSSQSMERCFPPSA